jgi:hypothetical protein
MKVLVACEFSGTVRDAFARRGHDAWSCDLEPSETPGKHHQGDVRPLLSQHWDMIIAHPTCRYITNSGVRWLDRDIERWKLLWDACQFFNEFIREFSQTNRVAIENPIPHKYALGWIGRKYDQIIQPWQFGHGETKATCLWLHNLPHLVPTNIVPGREARIHRMSPGPEREREREKQILYRNRGSHGRSMGFVKRSTFADREP